MIEEDLTEHCRVCLALPNATEVLDLNIIYDEEQQLSYKECFAICTNIHLLDNDAVELPHNLCKTCGVEMQLAYDFHKKVKNATQVLHQWHSQLKPNLTEIKYTSDTQNTGHQQLHEIAHEKGDTPSQNELNTSTLFLDIEGDVKSELDLGVEPISAETHLVGDTLVLEYEHLTEEIDGSKILNVQELTEYSGDLGVIVDEGENLGFDVPPTQVTIEHIVPIEQDASIEQNTTIDQDTPIEQDSPIELDVPTEQDSLEEHLELDEYQGIEMLEDEDAETLQLPNDDSSLPVEFLNESINLSDEDGDDIERDDDDTNDYNNEVLINDEDYDDEMYELLLNDSNTVENEAERQNTTNAPRQTARKMNSGPAISAVPEARKRYLGKSTCDQCYKEFPNHSRMMLHRRCHDQDRPKYSCNQCGRTYLTKQAMDAHVRTVHIKTGYTCPVCQKIYPIKKCLEVHLRFHTGDFPFVCELCGRKFALFSHLKTHKNVKHNNVRFSCEYPGCGKYFTSSASLRNHEFSHSAMPFECSYCQRGYPAKAKLRIHMKRKHGLDMTLEELESMRRFQVPRSKLNLVQVLQPEDDESS